MTDLWATIAQKLAHKLLITINSTLNIRKCVYTVTLNYSIYQGNTENDIRIHDNQIIYLNIFQYNCEQLHLKRVCVCVGVVCA